MEAYDVIVVGGGPAGLAAALKARETGAGRVLILERDRELGGILNQCIHNGFGLHYFKEELTGPEYAGRFIHQLQGSGIDVHLDTMALQIVPGGTFHQVHAVSRGDGYRVYSAKSLVLAMGCRERTRGAIAIPGTRPAGIFTAGTAQRYVNMEGYLVGRRVLILGSGDIGLIMARRMTLEGAKVLACVEVMPYSGGLNRNIVQCLQDYGIPLYLSHTIVEIRGERRVEQAVVAQVDGERRPIPGTEMVFDCDTILLSVGLIPENELTRGAGIPLDPRTNGAVVYDNMETETPGIFACGNVVHVHDLVDYVTAESQRAGAAAARFALGRKEPGMALPLLAGDGVSYTVPQHIRLTDEKPDTEVFFRVRRICGKSRICVSCRDRVLAAFRRERMAPGEMEHLSLPAALLRDAQGPVTLSIEEDAS